MCHVESTRSPRKRGPRTRPIVANGNGHTHSFFLLNPNGGDISKVIGPCWSINEAEELAERHSDADVEYQGVKVIGSIAVRRMAKFAHRPG